MPSSIEDKMQTWLHRAKEAAAKSVLQPTVAGYWPSDCLLAQEAKADCFCLSFPPPPKDKLPEFCAYMAMQLHYHNAQSYVYLSVMSVMHQGAAATAIGVFGSNKSMRSFWVTPYARSLTGEITFMDTFSVAPEQVGAFGDLFLDEKFVRPEMAESLKDLYEVIAKLPQDQLGLETPIATFFKGRNQDNPFPGMLPEEVFSICSTFLKSRQSEPLPSGSITLVGRKV